MIAVNNIPLFEEIRQYNQAISIPVPRFKEIDIRRFEENMKTVPAVMPPFKNSFYQVALVMEADGKVGQNHLFHGFENCTLFFNIPGQVLKWDIVKNWEGFYISFKPEFISLSIENQTTLRQYPFFKQGAKKFFSLDEKEAPMLFELFEKVFYEYSHPSLYNKTIIQSYLGVILNYGKRFFERAEEKKLIKGAQYSLVQQFQMLLDEVFEPATMGRDVTLKSVSEMAAQLYVSPKHLSEVLKEKTGKTALEHLHERIIRMAKSLLQNTTLTISEIAYQLGFENPPYFSRLFKKQTGQSPSGYRKAHSS